MTAYYNEIDPFAAEWLRQLIAAGHIAPGDVDTRSIVDVRPDDLKGYTQCHFFAGIGVWSYALRRAGWADSRPVWTGSCPCQPFSAAGKGSGFADERHLWPHFHWLISQCRPPIVIGEQVASKDGLAWLDLVQADLEGTGYTSGAVDTCAAGFGAPHIRQRLYWVAHADDQQSRARRNAAGTEGKRTWPEPSRRGTAGQLADTEGRGRREFGHAPFSGQGGHIDGGSNAPSELDNAFSTGLEGQRSGHSAALGQRAGSVRPVAEAGELGWVADAILAERQDREPGERAEYAARGRVEGAAAPSGLCDDLRPGPTNGQWRDADWLFCRDGKWRPIEPGTFPLAHGAAARVGRLRGYGNAINAAQAQGFIEAVQDTLYPALDLRLTQSSEMTTDNPEQMDIFS